MINKILPYELLPGTKIPTNPKIDLPTNKVKFELETVAAGVNELCATHKEIGNETKQALIDKTIIRHKSTASTKIFSK